MRILDGTTGCGGYGHIGTPTTDGFLYKLPAPRTRAVVWGGRLDVMQSTSTWLSKRGFLSLIKR